MSSLIEGYNYDIFISYRQKDNKYDGWVTEFVDNLKKELEATFKEEITVYYDVNPHDGLLETHDVAASLKEKLKCLILIPVISRTYCDPNSYAWRNEFVSFINQAKQDQFGLKVNLPNGNVSSRILPVRIHDLDPEDIKLVEEYLGIMRSVDFIYHFQGVNRPLRQRDDDVVQSQKQLLYRDQINKVANATDEIIRGLRKWHKIHPGENASGNQELIETKEKEKRKSITIKKPGSKANFHKRLSFVPWLITLIILGLAAVFGFRWYNIQKKIKWAQVTQIPAIQKMVDDNFTGRYFTVPTKAFDMATELEKIIPDDSNLIRLWPKISLTFSLQTSPDGADVYWKDYNEADSSWKYMGSTPLKDVRFPLGHIRMKFEKKGFQSVYYAGPDIYTFLDNDISFLKLDSVGVLPENMVRIPSMTADMAVVGLEQYGGKQVGEFLVDAREVTNKDFKRFVDAGGYSDKNFWKYPFYINSKIVSWDDAVRLFVDKTGKPGPSTWEIGTFPDGKEDYPVSGVSWYEAAAYAEFMDKKLPSVYHWNVIAQTGRTKDIIPLSNFNERSTLPSGSLQGITSFGVYDIAGNVREWCQNQGNDPGQCYILGGGFNDPTYSFNCAYTQLSVDRSASNGFRCIKEIAGDSASSQLNAKLELAFRDYKKEKPVDDNMFNIYLRQFRYDKAPLNPHDILIEESDLWKIEKVTLDAAYDDEKYNVWLFLPKNVQPPYQPVLFFPGSAVIFTDEFTTSEVSRMEFIVKSGRALVYPVVKGTFERRDGLKSDIGEETVFYKDHVIMWEKDISRTIDYLEERKDFQADRIGYFGYSWGGFLGGIIPAVENRIKAVVILVGGMQMNKTLPEVDQINYLPRVRQPVLMLNGKYDMFFPVETSQKPMYELLGSKIKEMKVYNEGHLVPRQDLVKETLRWYDENLGEVKK
ncbi:MAG: SUMF1/EgtB/PvdO family nonheme iron enzyme [Chloroflexota bacterium]